MKAFTKQVSLLVSLIFLIIERTTGQSLDDVKNLTQDLFKGYDVKQRPVYNQSIPVYVNVSLDMLTIQVHFFNFKNR